MVRANSCSDDELELLGLLDALSCEICWVEWCGHHDFCLWQMLLELCTSQPKVTRENMWTIVMAAPRMYVDVERLPEAYMLSGRMTLGTTLQYALRGEHKWCAPRPKQLEENSDPRS